MTNNPEHPPPKTTAADSATEHKTKSRLPISRRFIPRRLGRAIGLALLSIIGPLVALVFGLHLYLTGGRYISTDNAYLKSDKIAVSSDVSGRVERVWVHANQTVEPGTLLFRIDQEPFAIALEQAQAKLATAMQEVSALRFLYMQKRATLKQAQTDIVFHNQQFERQRQLRIKKIAAQVNFDSALRNLRNARDHVAVLTQDMARVRAKLGGDPDTPTSKHASVMTARSTVKQAELELKRTEIRAPVAGIVTNFELQRGEYVKSGDVVFSIVGTNKVWVQANYRETDLTHIRTGQTATIRIDAYPGKTWIATVESISPATGAEFALLPPQNTTGNWVKVVQRLPLRLKLEPRNHNDPTVRNTPGLPAGSILPAGPVLRVGPVLRAGPILRAGMSVRVKIDTHHKRKLGGFANAVVEWAQQLI